MSEPLFALRFGGPCEVTASAPGRVNLLGEHTDYNDGLVLPMAIPQRTTVALGRRSDDRLRAVSEQFAGPERVRALDDESRHHDFGDYLLGAIWALRRAGHRVGGVDAAVSSTVPVGSGLSSSAALLVAMLRALRVAFSLTIAEVELARLAHRAEHDFVGVPVGILDPMAVCLADAATALFLDVRSGAFERLALPTDADVLVVDSRIPHAHTTGGYATRRRECAEAAALLGVGSLRDVDAARLAAAGLPDRLHRRVRHVVTENARVEAATRALARQDARALGALFDASHASMRDDYEVSTPEIDALVAALRAQPGAFGARLTGGGFGGSVVALVERDRGGEVARGAIAAYQNGLRPDPAVVVGGDA